MFGICDIHVCFLLLVTAEDVEAWEGTRSIGLHRKTSHTHIHMHMRAHTHYHATHTDIE